MPHQGYVHVCMHVVKQVSILGLAFRRWHTSVLSVCLYFYVSHRWSLVANCCRYINTYTAAIIQLLYATI